MDLIIIIVFVILILSCMITAYVPYELQSLANQAGFSKFSLRFCILRIQKVPVKYLFEQYVKLTDSDVQIEFEEFKKYWTKNPDKLENTIRIILDAKSAGVSIPLNKIEKYNLNKNNSKRFFSVLKKLDNHKLNFSQEEIFELINSDIDIDSYFETLLNAQNFDINITEQNIKELNIEELNKYIENLHKAKSINYNPKSITKKDISQEEKNILLTNLIQIHQSKINISEDELFEIHKLKINTTDFIKAVELLQTEQFDNINQEDIKDHFIKGGNAAIVLESLLYAKANNTKLSPSVLFNIDLNKKKNIQDIVKKAVIPHEIDVPDASPTVLQDGIQIIPKIRLSVKNNINLHSSVLDETVYFNNINDIITNELLHFKSYQDLLSNLKKVVNNTLKQIYKIELDTDNIPYFVINFKIIDIDINSDTLANLKENQNKEKEEEAKIKLLNAKAKLQEDMSKALKNGSMSFKDYQKEKHIFGSFDNDELPYTD